MALEIKSIYILLLSVVLHILYIIKVDNILMYTHVCMLSSFNLVQLFATPGTVGPLAPLSMEFSKQECWQGLPCPPQWDLWDSGIKPTTLTSPALAAGFFTTSATWEAHLCTYICTDFLLIPYRSVRQSSEKFYLFSNAHVRSSKILMLLIFTSSILVWHFGLIYRMTMM